MYYLRVPETPLSPTPQVEHCCFEVDVLERTEVIGDSDQVWQVPCSVPCLTMPLIGEVG